MGRGATSLPGSVALMIDPDVIGHVSCGMDCVVVAGTNGKTTTNRVMHGIAEDAFGGSVTNASGANMLSGIASVLVGNSTLSGSPRCMHATLEVDEASMPRVCAGVNPRVIVVTNVFRDQLDRYGELVAAVRDIERGIAAAPDARLVLNADDPNTSAIADGHANPVTYYGLSCGLYAAPVAARSAEVSRCPDCGHAYAYDRVSYGPIGRFRCPVCGRKAPDADVAVTSITDRGESSCTLGISAGGRTLHARASVPAGYDVYNCLAAVTAMSCDGVDLADAMPALSRFEHAFGRGEELVIGGSTVSLTLAKNPTGADQALSVLTGSGGRRGLAVLLGDADCDGNDVSWIYDTAYEDAVPHVAMPVIAAGARRYDMALRLRYAGADVEIAQDYDALTRMIAGASCGFDVVANYSEMMAYRHYLSAHGYVREFWEGTC